MYRIEIPHWVPMLPYSSVDAQMIGISAHKAGIPKAECKRRISAIFKSPGKSIQAGDIGGLLKIALTPCGLLRDDSAKWCELGTVTFARAENKACTIILEDIPHG